MRSSGNPPYRLRCFWLLRWECTRVPHPTARQSRRPPPILNRASGPVEPTGCQRPNVHRGRRDHSALALRGERNPHHGVCPDALGRVNTVPKFLATAVRALDQADVRRSVEQNPTIATDAEAIDMVRPIDIDQLHAGSGAALHDDRPAVARPFSSGNPARLPPEQH
jgi:hypothetical protein